MPSRRLVGQAYYPIILPLFDILLARYISTSLLAMWKISILIQGLPGLLCLCVALTTAGAAPLEMHVSQPPCNFSQYIKNKVTSWEFQLDLPAERCVGKRSELLASVAQALSRLGDDAFFSIDLDSVRTSVFDQTSTAISTLDGKPIYDSKYGVYPWRGPGFLRYRRKYTYTQKDGHIGVQPGEGDLTLKLKDINLDAFDYLVDSLNFAPFNSHCGLSTTSKPKLKWKLENDRYCSIGRATYEANYHPVRLSPYPGKLVSYEEVEDCFPSLWDFLGYEQDTFPLPDYNYRAFSKTVYDIKINSNVSGVANFVISYPRLLDALTGGDGAVECELSFRLKRKRAENERALDQALQAVVHIMEKLHADGWDTGVH